ncbi:MAG: M56 family metallopeptidase, partial [Gimesia sp.]
MQFFALSPQLGLLILNVAVASIALGLVAVSVGFLVPRWALPTRHGLFCVALVLTLVCPFAIWTASSQGLGIVPILLGSDTAASKSSLSPDEAVIDLPLSESLIINTNDMVVDRSETDGPSTVEQKLQTSEVTADPTSHDLAGTVLQATPESTVKLTSFEFIRRVGGVLALVWVAVSFWFLLKLVRGLLVIRRLRNSLKPTTDPRIINAVLQALPDTGNKVMAPVFESQIVPAPLTLGFWRSVIVMPEGLAESLNESELACVLAHEVAHVSRHDTVIAFLQQLAGIGFWWNPLLRIINRQICQLRERICDDHVVARLGDGHPLAEAIVKVAEWSVTSPVRFPLTTTFLEDGDDIEQRITRLIKSDRRFSIKLNLKSKTLIGLFGILLAAIPLIPAVRAQVVTPQSVIVQEIAPQKVIAQAIADDLKAEEWQVRIHAVDMEGKPIANPQIGVQLGYKQDRVWQTGDGEGIFTATLPTRTPDYCYLLARADGYAPMRAFWRYSKEKNDDALPAEFTFKMTNAITVGGTVVDEDNQPIENASVLFSASSKNTNPVQRAKTSFYQEKFVTDQRGRWRCNLAPSTMSDASIKVSHPDYVSPAATFDQTKQIPELRELKHSWTLKKGFVITGQVVDKEGTPITGAILALGELNTSSREGPFARTDAEGRYRFERVSPHNAIRKNDSSIRFTITIMKRGYMPIFESVPGYGNRPLEDSTEQKRIVNFTLKQGVKLKLHVVDSQNKPVKGAWVMLKSWHDTTALQVIQKHAVPTETNAQGHWEWNNAPPGEPIRYDILKRGFADIRDLEITVDGTETEKTIILKQPQFITGKVVDAKTRQPIANFIVERAFENVAGHPDGLSWANDLTRGKNGTYEKRVTMPPHNGHYTYRARAEGYKTAVSKSTPFKEGKTTVNFELQPKPAVKKPEAVSTSTAPQVKSIIEEKNSKLDKAKSSIMIPRKNAISGRIVDQNKLGIGGARVALVAYSDFKKQDNGRVIASGVADSLGNYSLNVPAAEMKKREFGAVWAKAEGYVAARSTWSTIIPALSGRKPSEMSLAATAGTSVNVLDSAGNPLSGVRVIPRKIGVPRGVGYPMPKVWEEQSTGITGEDGKTNLPHVAPGALKEMILIPPGKMGRMRYNQNFFLNVRPAKIAPHFKLRLPETGSVKGQLVVAKGFTLPKGLPLTLESVPRRPTGFQHIVDVPVAADGTFSIDKLAVGSVFVPEFLPEDQPLRA